MDIPLIDWLLKNKEWVFSGGGVAIVAGIFALVRRFRQKQHPETAPVIVRMEHGAALDQPDISSHVPVRAQRVSSITPAEIRAAIEAAPPLQRDALVTRYNGVRIEWDTELGSAEEAPNGTVKLFLRAHGQGASLHYAVICKVNLADYRELAVLPEGANIRVNGTIEKATPNWVSLVEARLTFLSASDA
jgi:hypothetical protein